MMRTLFDFARINGIARYVTVTTVAVERLIRRLGVNVSRLRVPPLRSAGSCRRLLHRNRRDYGIRLLGTLPEDAQRKAA